MTFFMLHSHHLHFSTLWIKSLPTNHLRPKLNPEKLAAYYALPIFTGDERSFSSYCENTVLLSKKQSHDLFLPIRYISSNGHQLRGEISKPSSKVEETVQALKEKAKIASENGPDKSKDINSEKKSVEAAVPKKSLKQKVVDEIMHYYHGFRLLFIDINVSRKLIWKILKGNNLSRREHNLLVRTTSDMFRLVPFSIFIIVPFMEFLLPFFIKFFPGMLPSTFQTATDKDNKLKQSLKVKLEMAKFLQETLDNMSLKGAGHSSTAAKEFAEFFEKVRSEGKVCTSEEIMKFSKLFEDEITLDSLQRPQLLALCRVLELRAIGTSTFLRFQLRMKLRSLHADDITIQKEGVDSLSLSELQQACKTRGMRAYGLSEKLLKLQLNQWLDLSLNKKVPPSLLLLSRAFMLPETVDMTANLKATISALPETVAVSTKAAIGEREGKVDHKTKIEIIKEEQRRIEEETAEIAEEKKLEEEIAAKEKLRSDAELLVDKAARIVDSADVLEPITSTMKKKLEDEKVTTEDIQTLEDALNALSDEKKKMQVEKEELDELREELADYKEDVEDLKEVLSSSVEAEKPQLKESKAAKRLFNKVNNMLNKLDEVVLKLDQKEKELKHHHVVAETDKDKKSDENELMKIDELVAAIKKIQTVPDDSKLERITEVLSSIDEDHDGSVRIDTVLKVLELIGKENVKLSTKQIDEVIDLLEKEEALEMEEKEREDAAEAKKEKIKVDLPPISEETLKTIPPGHKLGKDNVKPPKSI